MDSSVAISGKYTKFQGVVYRIFGPVGEDHTILWREGDDSTIKVLTKEIGTIRRFATVGIWRGAAVSIEDEISGDFRFYTSDSVVAEREGLEGNSYAGWAAIRPVKEFQKVVTTEEVMSHRGSVLKTEEVISHPRGVDASGESAEGSP